MARNIQYFNRTKKDILSLIPFEVRTTDALSGTGGTSGTDSLYTAVYTLLPENVKTTGTKSDIGMGSVLGNLNTGINTNNQILSEFVFVNGTYNYVGPDSENIVVVGDRNSVGNLSINSGILGGSDNTITGGVTNSWLIGVSDKEISSSNEIWIGNDLHIVEGQVQTVYQFVDGGYDENVNINATTSYFTIDGGLDQSFEEFPEDPIHVIEGGIDNI